MLHTRAACSLFYQLTGPPPSDEFLPGHYGVLCPLFSLPFLRSLSSSPPLGDHAESLAPSTKPSASWKAPGSTWPRSSAWPQTGYTDVKPLRSSSSLCNESRLAITSAQARDSVSLFSRNSSYLKAGWGKAVAPGCPLPPQQ